MNNEDSNVIIKELYPFVESAIKVKTRSFLQNVSKFFNARHEDLYDVAPYNRIYFNKNDKDNFFKSIGIEEKDVDNIIKNCFFYDKDYRPQCAKEPYVETLMCIIRYFIKNNESKNALIATMYLCFSGKFYASLHTYFWKYPPNKSIMDYVVNNMLSDKFDLKKEGTIFGAIEKLSETWIDTYSNKSKSKRSNINSDQLSDDDIGKLLQQLRDRLKSFMKNISNAYYEASENKYYLNYETDSLDEDNFRLTTNDAAKAARITEATMGIITSQKVDMRLCNSCSNESIRPNDLKDILESILEDRDNLSKLRRVVNIIICLFMMEYPNSIVGGVEFIQYSIKLKPNSKDKLYLEMKSTIEDFLNKSSSKYRNQTRIATKNNYYRAVLTYIVLTISKVSLK